MKKRKIGEVILDYQYYKPEVQYSDGDIEDLLLEAARNDRLQELLETDNRWAVLYHCAKDRENLLDWYPFKKTAALLEVGAGCGALTGLFSSRVSSVTCIELSEKRSLINAYRNKDHQNINILLGNFQDIKIKEKYDYITLIGVWEYAALYLGGSNPYLQMLQMLKGYLKPDGKLLIAIENKMGIKYWNGAQEDHTGNLYSGLNDYVDDTAVRTFSHREIEDMLKVSGYDTYKFYYPVPDYKLPDTIYTDERLPMPGEVRNYKEDYSASRIYNFYDATIEDQICQDNMFSYFANSFLVECGLQPEDVVYAKYSRIRREKYMISTVITKKETGYTVQKNPLSFEAAKHISQMSITKLSGLPRLNLADGHMEKDSYVMDYVAGKKVDSLFYFYRNDIEQFVKKTKEILETYLKPDEEKMVDFVFTDAYGNLFGDSYIDNAKCLKASNIDLIFSNLILTERGEMICIDNEWVYDFPIPYEYVIWRSVSFLYTEYMIYLRNKISRTEFLIAVGLNENHFSVYRSMEKNFEKNISGHDYKEKYKKASMMCKMILS